jgi:hypothetical protein
MSPAPSGKTTNEQKDCPIFRLPPELRNKVYEYAFSEARPKQKTTTRLPIANPVEVIDLDDAPVLRPSNELLATCYIILAEARGVFVTAQRAFLASNNFQITLKKDWEGATTKTETATKPRATITHLRPQLLHLITRIVISVKENRYLDEVHLVRLTGNADENMLGWNFDKSLHRDDPTLTTNMSMAQATLETSRVVIVLGRLTGQLIRAFLSSFHLDQIGKYLEAARMFVKCTTMDRRELSKREIHMLDKLKELVIRQNSLSFHARATMKTTLLNAVLEHLCEQNGVQLKPHDALE